MRGVKVNIRKVRLINDWDLSGKPDKLQLTMCLPHHTGTQLGAEECSHRRKINEAFWQESRFISYSGDTTFKARYQINPQCEIFKLDLFS